MQLRRVLPKSTKLVSDGTEDYRLHLQMETGDFIFEEASSLREFSLHLLEIVRPGANSETHGISN